MEFEEWEPVYQTILADFGYSQKGDLNARDRLAEFLEERETFAAPELPVAGRQVAVAGAGPTLEAELDRARAAEVVIAASTATDRLEDVGITVDCMVTDLDKNPETARTLAERGTPVAVHAHGDNIPAVEEIVPALDTAFVIPTTQAEPVGPVRNFGGFTDGDRGAFLADALGADSLVFPGWSFDDETVGVEKARKLVWAERLLHWLERRRDEEFDVLDGRRDAIDTDWLPE